jgi:Zn-finger nucleic acid-binding protein
VRVLGEAMDHLCPLCRTPLVSAAIEGQDVLHCSNCRGVLSQRQAFIEILKRRRSNQPDDRRPLDPEELKRQVQCPLCQQQMETHPYYGPGHLVIDTCGRCAVIWFDHGEIDRIVRADQDRR